MVRGISKSNIILEKKATKLNEQQRKVEHVKAMLRLVSVMLKPEKEAPIF